MQSPRNFWACNRARGNLDLICWYTEEVYQSSVCLVSHSLPISNFRGDWGEVVGEVDWLVWRQIDRCFYTIVWGHQKMGLRAICSCQLAPSGTSPPGEACFLRTYPGPGRSWIAGPAGKSRLGPNSEPRGNNRSFPETRERDRVPVKKIGSRDSIFGLVNSTYSFEITNHNQLVSNIKYLANFIKKYWAYFRYQKLGDFLMCLPPSVRV